MDDVGVLGCIPPPTTALSPLAPPGPHMGAPMGAPIVAGPMGPDPGPSGPTMAPIGLLPPIAIDIGLPCDPSPTKIIRHQMNQFHSSSSIL